MSVARLGDGRRLEDCRRRCFDGSLQRAGRGLEHHVAVAPSWSVSIDANIRKAPQELVGSAQLLFADAQRKPLLIVSLHRRSGKLSMLEVEIVRQSKLKTILTSNWVPGGDEVFSLRLSRVGRSLRVVLDGDKFLHYVETTPEIPSEVLKSLFTFGLGAETSDVEFSAIRLQSPWSEPTADVVRAEAAMEDLLAHFWTGGLENGCIVPTSHGYPARIARTRMEDCGGAMMVFAMDTLHRATGDPTLAHRLRTEWSRLKRLYTIEELEAAGGPLHPAADDAGWDALLYLALYRHTNDRDALERAHGLVNHSFRQWRDDELGGGLWYNNQRKTKSLYTVALALAALKIAAAAEDQAMKAAARDCYEWMEANLLRSDGLYWTDRDRRGPIGAADPNRISEGSSVTYLGGNMGMGVLHARLYRLTGDKTYLERAIRTSEAIANKQT